MNRVRLSLSFGLFLVAAGVASCTPSSSDKGGTDGPHATIQSPAPAATTRSNQIPGDMRQHWVQNEQLRGLMKELSAKTQRNWPKDVPQNPEDPQSADPQNAMDAAAKLADGLSAAAIRIPQSVANSRMSEADRAGFQAEADTLRDQALRLGQAARAKKVEPMQQYLDAISATCISCHSRYRDFSGQLNIQQASRDSVR